MFAASSPVINMFCVVVFSSNSAYVEQMTKKITGFPAVGAVAKAKAPVAAVPAAPAAAVPAAPAAVAAPAAAVKTPPKRTRA